MRQLSTTAPFGFEFDPARFLATYRALGCRWAEYYRNTVNPPATAQALRIADAAGVRFDSVHGVFGHDIDPSSPDKAHRDQCLRIYEREARLALDLGAPVVIVHPSANYKDLKPIPAADADLAQASRWHHFDDFASRLAAIGERLSVKFLFENVPRNFPLGHDPAELARRTLAVGSKRLRLCFDVGHAHITADLPGALRSCAPAIEYLHIHDNNGADDQHLMPGDGAIDWTAFAAALHESRLNVPCMLEVFYDLHHVDRLAGQGLAARLRAACALNGAVP